MLVSVFLVLSVHDHDNVDFTFGTETLDELFVVLVINPWQGNSRDGTSGDLKPWRTREDPS
jgi:hypothetical protein